MLSQEIIISRLALIKQLFKIGLEQSKLPEPTCAFSILTFHDSVEMFLKLLAEQNGVKADNFNFLDYWSSIPTLTLRESMKNLNARRVNIKHKGLLPSKTDIEISRINAIDFFEQNTIKHLHIEFSAIALTSLVQLPTVKAYLEKSQDYLASGEFDNSIEYSAIAYAELIHLYESNKSHYSGYSPFYFGQELRWYSSFLMDVEDRKMAEFVDRVRESMDSMRDAIKVISLGIDYRRFAKFKLLTPVIHRMPNGKYHGQIMGSKKWTESTCQYCIDFVIEVALKLQDFNFDISEIEDDPYSVNKNK